MASSKTREKRRAARQRKNLLARQEADLQVKAIDDETDLEEEDEILDEDEEVEEEEPTEKMRKDMGGMDAPDAMDMPMGPTSWDELDALETSREQAEMAGEASYSVSQLVQNILCSPMSPTEKGKAIADVGTGFVSRVKDIMSGKMVDKEYDLDLLEAEAMLSKEYRHLTVSEKIADWIEKKKLSYAAEQKLSDADFALVTTRDGKKVRKYPIHDKAHVRNALARAAQMMARGGQAAADAKAAMPKIRAAAKKMGIGMQKENGILIEKDASGSWRWIGWPTNNFKDHSADIITEAAHLDYVDWVNKDIANNAPVFTSCHAPGTARAYPADFAAYENGFVVMSGRLTEGEAVALLKASAKCDIGMSHTGWGWRDPENPSHIIKYRSFEVTDLPVETADNPFTFMELSKEVDMISQLDYLTELLGSKEKAERALKLKTSMKQKELQDAGVESKEKTSEAPPAAEKKTEPAVDLAAIVERVSKELGMEELSEEFSKMQAELEKIPVLEALVKDLSQNREEELAGMISAPAGKTLAWMKKDRPSTSDKNVLKEGDETDEKLKKSKPEVGWLSEATGTQPIVQ